MNRYDLVFVGHVTLDDIEALEGSGRGVPGGAPLFGAFAACRSGSRTAVVTRMAEEDRSVLLEPLKEIGIHVYLQPARHTTHMRVVHPTGKADERLMYQTEDAGFFQASDLPPLDADLIHLGALTDREFTLGFMRGLKQKGFRLSVDMQGFVRQIDPGSGVIRFRDVPHKEEIASLADFVKLDVVEAEILTGTRNLEEAGRIVEAWGASEIVLTSADGAFARHEGATFFAKYSNRNSHGRTGRGDTTMGAYLARRKDHDVHDSLDFAAALASIKMETPGPFRGSIEDVIARMQEPLVSPKFDAA